MKRSLKAVKKLVGDMNKELDKPLPNVETCINYKRDAITDILNHGMFRSCSNDLKHIVKQIKCDNRK